jgi:hypothetical protein
MLVQDSRMHISRRLAVPVIKEILLVGKDVIKKNVSDKDLKETKVLLLQDQPTVGTEVSP